MSINFQISISTLNSTSIPAVGGLNLEVEVALDVEVYLGT